MRTLYDSILPLVKEQERLARLAVKQYSPQVNSIIREGDSSPERIERLLDGMLNFCYNDDMLKLYKKLCRHFYKFDPRATVFYVNAYRDMWDGNNDHESI